jgi:outer membrane lipoprotein-sorting protein
MRRLRTASTRRLLLIVAVLVAAVAGAGIAQAALTTASKPAPKPLDRALLDAANAKPVEGVTARIKFTNNLLPSGSLPEGTASPALTGASGRLWLSNDGKLRLELQSANGDAQIVADGKRFLIYDAASKQAFTGKLQAREKQPESAKSVTLGGVQGALAQLGQAWTFSGATPSNTAGQPSYTVRIAPKDDGGLLGAAEVAWDAARGVPLRAAVYAQGDANPVLEIEATDISYGAIPAAKVDATPPRGARVTEIDPSLRMDAQGKPVAVEGVENVQKELDFPLSAPDELAGLPRKAVRLIKTGDKTGAVSTYGQGLGQILVFQSKADSGQSAIAPGGLTLPQVNIDGATGSELATALGTLLTFQREGVQYVVVGSVPPIAAENAARGLK